MAAHNFAEFVDASLAPIDEQVVDNVDHLWFATARAKSPTSRRRRIVRRAEGCEYPFADVPTWSDPNGVETPIVNHRVHCCPRHPKTSSRLLEGEKAGGVVGVFRRRHASTLAALRAQAVDPLLARPQTIRDLRAQAGHAGSVDGLTASGKVYGRGQQIGDEGIAVVDRAITRLGFRWHDRPKDLGIDGVIELVDPHTHQALNQSVLAQVKATESGFAGDSPSSFHFLCTRDDLAYWKNASDPVVLVCVDIRTDEIWWQDIRAAVPVGRQGSAQVQFDKLRDRLDESSVGDLLALNRRARGSQRSQADSGRAAKREVLLSNLLPVKSMPDTVHVADAVRSSPRAFGRLMRDAHCYRSDWVLRGHQMYSFTNPRDSEYSAFVDGSEAIEVEHFSLAKDLDTKHLFMDLLRQTLLEARHRDLRFRGRKPRYFHFRATSDLEERKVAVGSSTGRSVFKAYWKNDDSIDFCRHEACAITFNRIGDAWFAALNPTYHFTFDGHRVQPWSGERVAKMKKRERNDAVRTRTKFWANYLASGSEASLLDSGHPIRFGALLTVDTNAGIDDASWARPDGHDESSNALTLWDGQ